MKKERVVIPSGLSRPKERMEDYAYALYGRRKIGKTTMLAQAGKAAFFCKFEEGTRALAVRALTIKNWRHFKKIIEALEEDTKGIRFVVIDTAEVAYRMCQQYVCDKMSISYPGDAPHGKGWDRLRWEFHDAFNRLSKLGVGIWFICHQKQQEVEPEDDATYIQITPRLSKQAAEIILDAVDVIAYYHYGKKGKRYLSIRGTKRLEAGNRIEHAFVGVKKIPMGGSPEESWHNFRMAFKNKMKRRTDNG